MGQKEEINGFNRTFEQMQQQEKAYCMDQLEQGAAIGKPAATRSYQNNAVIPVPGRASMDAEQAQKNAAHRNYNQ